MTDTLGTVLRAIVRKTVWTNEDELNKHLDTIGSYYPEAAPEEVASTAETAAETAGTE